MTQSIPKGGKMIFSIYPTDSMDVRTSILQQALTEQCLGENLIYTSLHIPESSDLKNYLFWLKNIHKEKGFSFFADISPLAFEKLNLDFNEVYKLKDYGIIGLRIDFGFSIETIKIFAQNGFQIALNASTVKEEIVKDLADFNLIAWHNYYPRPETGINESFFISQNNIFEKYGIPIYVFIPGENNFRAPLHLGLPALEHQRGKNAYVNFLEFALKYPNIKIVCAEGYICRKHFNWINRYEKEKVVVFELSYVDENIFDFLKAKIFNIRIEKTDFSWRIENTRSKINPSKTISGLARLKASLQMDSQKYGRYQGEIHIIKKDLPPDPLALHIANISEKYKNIIDFLAGGEKIIFVKE
jgi:hypothetical protein